MNRRDDESAERLRFHAGVVDAEARHLARTDGRLFAEAITAERIAALESDEALSERIDAFVARLGRLQDTIADRLLPALLEFTSERTGTVIDNLDRAERLGWLRSVDEWATLRKLRNRMIHEYVTNPEDLAAALTAAHHAVPLLLETAATLVREIRTRTNDPADASER